MAASSIFDTELSPGEKEAIKHFRLLEATHGATIDPRSEHDWHSVALGYFVAKGFGFSRVAEMARFAAYGDPL